MNSLAYRSCPAGRGYYALACLVVFAIVFAGFARSYYLKALFGAPPLTGLVHVHGLMMTGWFVLFFTQACLIAEHRVDIHRRLGIFGAVYGAALVIVALVTAFRLYVPNGAVLIARKGDMSCRVDVLGHDNADATESIAEDRGEPLARQLGALCSKVFAVGS